MRHDKKFKPLESYHESFIPWIRELLGEDKFIMWVIERGCILHHSLINDLINYRELQQGVTEYQFKFWEFIIYRQDILSLRLRDHWANHSNFPKNISQETVAFWIQKELTVYVKIDSNFHDTNFKRSN